MYAVVKTGGKQVRMTPGTAVRVERLPGDVGDTVELCYVDQERETLDPDKTVWEVISNQGRGPKLTIFKMKRRKGYRRKTGHRQGFTEIRVESIQG